MKTIGLIGGMSWESTVPYYRIINETVREELGGFHSAPLLLYSIDFAEMEHLQEEGRWAEACEIVVEAAVRLENAGADFIVVCSNTMHIAADRIISRVRIPLLHIADATSAAVTSRGFTTVGLLGTRFTMEQDFYRGRLESQGLKVLTPGAEARELVHRVIYDELCLGRINEASRKNYKDVIQHLVAAGAQAIILGCTEIGLLISDADSPVPTFDTAEIHARAAAQRAL